MAVMCQKLMSEVCNAMDVTTGVANMDTLQSGLAHHYNQIRTQAGFNSLMGQTPFPDRSSFSGARRGQPRSDGDGGSGLIGGLAGRNLLQMFNWAEASGTDTSGGARAGNGAMGMGMGQGNGLQTSMHGLGARIGPPMTTNVQTLLPGAIAMAVNMMRNAGAGTSAAARPTPNAADTSPGQGGAGPSGTGRGIGTARCGRVTKVTAVARGRGSGRGSRGGRARGRARGRAGAGRGRVQRIDEDSDTGVDSG
jgi:hypothetical protein